MTDPRVPEPVTYVRDLLTGLDATWFLCGGWAADAWLGRETRPHVDVDIAVFHHEQGAVFEHMAGWAVVAHDPNVPDDTSEPWDGRALDLPAHVHVPTAASPLSTSATARHSEFEFEFLFNECSGGEWVLNREPRVALPLDRCAWQPPSWGVPTAAPEIVLFYKAGGHLGAAEAEFTRAHDEADFHAILPTLSPAQRAWLRDALATVHPQHKWLAHLAT